MTANDLRKKYLEFFQEKSHKIIPSASLVPANDPTVLFTTAGMHPLVPYLLGQSHPEGRRLTNVQKCLRTDDLDEIGDDTHLTFFEMLGNWSLGDYWKEESIIWSYEFLTSSDWLNLDKSKLAVSVFAGDADAPRDEESAKIWTKLGFEPGQIAYLPKKDNWWGPPGVTGPCGPDTEMFYWTGTEDAPASFQDTHNDPNWVEIWNNVFMQYEKQADGKFTELAQRNVDTGMGLERMAAILENKNSVYETEILSAIIDKIKSLEQTSDKKSERIIADHMRAATFLLADGVVPSNKDRGYIARRLIRRSVTYGQKLGIEHDFTTEIANVIIENYSHAYPELKNPGIEIELKKEELKFRTTLGRGLKILEKNPDISGAQAFDLFQTYGFPFELTREFANVSDPAAFEQEFKKHQELSRTASAGQFKGGLADHSDKVVRLHTATHLLNAALRKVLGPGVWQKGSNITEERTRFDFTHGQKLTEEQKTEVERFVNEWIKRDLSVKRETMPLTQARDLSAIGVFGEKYPDEVSVYTIYDKSLGEIISREFCGGPHVEHTGQIGQFKIQKEEAVSAGVRRIKAIIE
ncbi:MAG TPA: alanine--tRNA ligase [Patescibacteria group bacterium]|nr:alanine--tRNA ligase [Patescibacteria group bacterium]